MSEKLLALSALVAGAIAAVAVHSVSQGAIAVAACATMRKCSRERSLKRALDRGAHAPIANKLQPRKAQLPTHLRRPALVSDRVSVFDQVMTSHFAHCSRHDSRAVSRERVIDVAPPAWADVQAYPVSTGSALEAAVHDVEPVGLHPRHRIVRIDATPPTAELTTPHAIDCIIIEGFAAEIPDQPSLVR